MAAGRTPWLVIAAALVAVVVAAGALVGAVVVREHRADSAAAELPPTSVAPPTVTGCLAEPCQVLASTPVAGTTVQLVADAGARSGRLRIGGPSSSDVIETTITDLGVTLTKDSLQCVATALSACLVSGAYEDGVAGQVVVGRSGKWSSLSSPFVSGAGYLALAEVAASQSGPEVIAAQYACAEVDCADSPVFAQVFAISSGTEVGCTQDHDDVESLPGYPEVTLTDDELAPC
ncbi:hypothetical protein [Actinophytocola sediminis]